MDYGGHMEGKDKIIHDTYVRIYGPVGMLSVGNKSVTV